MHLKSERALRQSIPWSILTVPTGKAMLTIKSHSLARSNKCLRACAKVGHVQFFIFLLEDKRSLPGADLGLWVGGFVTDMARVSFR